MHEPHGTGPPDAFTAWVSYHAKLFGMDSERDVASLLAWRDLFDSAGYSPAELRAASDALALSPEPLKWREDHRRELVRHLRAARQDRLTRPATDGETSYPSCWICGGGGWVCGLPDLRQVKSGQWLGSATCAVLCSCSYGQKEGQRHSPKEDRRRPMTLMRYEALNPKWLEQQSLRAETVAAEAKASDQTSAADRLLGPIVRRLLAGVKGGKP